tara:strand:+ start:12312 stop:13049 length:738 start_codon:yes stop_codon:yes gene_type:complete
MRIWNKLTIEECNEPLVPIPLVISRLTPHPYLSLGAPYGKNVDPWRLRVDVVRRLLLAEDCLHQLNPRLSLAVFDAWRPRDVQKFMVDYVIEEQCKLKGIIQSDVTDRTDLDRIIEDVNNFWASPCSDPRTPPPHSTGAAVDLTLIGENGLPIDMGGEIDHIGPVSAPDYYAEFSKLRNPYFNEYHSRRELLRTVMEKVGFSQHPNEWWHFSFGDQLWAWKQNSINAIYGAVVEASKANIELSSN